MNILESKDGIDFEDEFVKESIHTLANIDIQEGDIFTVISKIKGEVHCDSCDGLGFLSSASCSSTSSSACTKCGGKGFIAKEVVE